MEIEEQGTVTELRGGLALVRASRSSSCSGCAASEHCSTGKGGEERIVEAENPAGAQKGDRVVIAVSSSALLQASFRIYIVPVMGLLAGAGLFQLAASFLFTPETAGMAAGIGGLVGAGGAMLLQSRLFRRGPSGNLRPRIVRIV